MRGTKAIVVVCLCFATCLVGLVVAHIDLRKETVQLRRAVRLATLASTDAPDVPYEIRQDIERLDSSLTKIKYRVDEVDSKVDQSDFDKLKDKVDWHEISIADSRSLAVREISNSPDIVKRFELDQETQALEKRIENIEDKLRISRY